jgi:hypothetical protein
MRRVRLGTTSYGDVTPPDKSDSVRIPEQPVCEPARRDDRWTTRRGALSRELVLDAQALFERRMARPISENEARNLLGNLTDYVWMLVNWEVSLSPENAPSQRPKRRARKRRKAKSRKQV